MKCCIDILCACGIIQLSIRDINSDPDDQHLKQGFKRHVEDLQGKPKSKTQDGTKPDMKTRRNIVQWMLFACTGLVGCVTLGAPKNRVANLHAPRRHRTGLMVVAMKASEYALELFTRRMLRSPDWSSVNRRVPNYNDGHQRGSRDEKRALDWFIGQHQTMRHEQCPTVGNS